MSIKYKKLKLITYHPHLDHKTIHAVIKSSTLIMMTALHHHLDGLEF